MASTRPALIVRRIVLGLSALCAAWGIFHIARSFIVDGKLRWGNPISADPAVEELEEGVGTQPLSVKAEVTRVKGNIDVRPGDKCDFLVERVQQEGTLGCRTQVMCGSKLLYGGPQRGYFPCRFFEGDRRDVLGSDPSTTKDDQDGAIRLDTRAGVLRVWDDASGSLGEFDVEAEVLLTQ